MGGSGTHHTQKKGESNLNKALLIGRLTRDPEIRWTQGQDQTCCARFTLAVDRRNAEKEADFIACVAWGKLAESAEKYLKQGSKIAVEGSIRTGNYTNREGKKVYYTEISVWSWEFAEGKREGTAEQAAPTEGGAFGFVEIPEGFAEGLPFN